MLHGIHAELKELRSTFSGENRNRFWSCKENHPEIRKVVLKLKGGTFYWPEHTEVRKVKVIDISESLDMSLLFDNRLYPSNGGHCAHWVEDLMYMKLEADKKALENAKEARLHSSKSKVELTKKIRAIESRIRYAESKDRK